ncbi:MAG: DUF6036 family nucleotidyltransferase [Candidatus Krumholzibacteria bacterium]|nr:DUF6036 family nucleotidyltransferase [Candidatus Krumholzibacteria bacterium]
MLNRLKDVFASFQKHDVRYVVIGGVAAILYGVPRATLITEKELLSNEITVFKDKVRIDVQTSTPGLSFRQAWDNRQTMKYQSQPFYVASKSDLIASKRAASRDIDLEDIKLLELPENPEVDK